MCVEQKFFIEKKNNIFPFSRVSSILFFLYPCCALDRTRVSAFLYVMGQGSFRCRLNLGIIHFRTIYVFHIQL